jgi:aminoglycoside/choline kinase family phosphotransferase
LLDFQDAVRGWDAWDMAMLTQDARRRFHRRLPKPQSAIIWIRRANRAKRLMSGWP